jgi:uncharacterized membrane protein
MQGLKKIQNNGIHGYVFMISFGIVFGALTETLLHERVMFASSVITGIMFAAVHRINRSLDQEPLITKALLSTAFITVFELCFGIVMNEILHLHLWDFSDSTFHLLGQICPRECFFRFLTAIPAIFLSKYADVIPIKNEVNRLWLKRKADTKSKSSRE